MLPFKKIGAFLLLVCVGVVVSLVSAAPTHAVAQSSDEPVEASTSVLVTNITGMDLETGTFQANFYLAITCDQACASDDWDILNAISFTRQEVYSQGFSQWWLVRGLFSFDPDLTLYPFDTQTLELRIEHTMLDQGDFVFIPNAADSEVAADVNVSGWDRGELSLASASSDYPSLDFDYSRMTIAVPIHRSELASLLKFYVPLAIFVLLGTATLVLSRNDFQIRTGGTVLIGLSLFYLATSRSAGQWGSLTLWDASVILGFLVLGLVLASGVIGSYLFNEGAYDGPDGPQRNKRMRFRFLKAASALIAIGTVSVIAVAVTT